MKNLKFTLKAWPVITSVTIGLSFITQAAADWLGIELPVQDQMKLVLEWGRRSLESLPLFMNFMIICAQVIFMAPLLEEPLFRLPSRFAWKRQKVWIGAVTVLSALFSFAHYVDYITLFKTGALIIRPADNAFLALFFFGLAQCWLYQKTKALWCPMLQHALFNVTNLVLLFIFPDSAT